MATQRAWLVLAVSSVATFLVFVDMGFVNIAFPDMQRSFPASSPAVLSWVFAAFNLVFAALLITAGRLADLVGRRRVFLGGLVLFGIGAAAAALAPNPGVLIGARAVQAVGAALLTPASLALLLPAFPAERRATAVGVWGAMGGVAAAVGPSLGGVLVNVWGWRAVFVAGLPVVVVAVVAGRRLLPESRDPAAELPDAVSVGLVVAGIGAVTLAIVQAGTWGGWSLVALGAGAALLALLVRRSIAVPRPIVEPALFRLRSFGVGVGATLLFSVAFYALLLGNVLYLTQVWRLDLLVTGIAVAPGAVLAAAGSSLGGRAVDRYGVRAVVVPGGLLFAAGCAMFALRLGPEPEYLATFLPATLLTGTGVGLVYAGLAAAVVAELPPARYATGSAVGTCCRQLGAVLGVAALLGVAPDGSTAAYALMALGGLGAAGAGLALRSPAPVG